MLVDQPGDQPGLQQQGRTDRLHLPAISLPRGCLPEINTALRRKAALADVPVAQLTPVIHWLSETYRYRLDAAGRFSGEYPRRYRVQSHYPRSQRSAHSRLGEAG